MVAQKHKVWLVRVGSLDDERLDDRIFRDVRAVVIAKLSELRRYLIEAAGHGARAERMALELADADGISRPVVLSVEWINR